VRAQNLSACGYERPTSPTLERLVAEGHHLNCTAIAPGSWTLPSHASYFTGLEAPEHGAHATETLAPETGGRPLGAARPLAPEFETLAELHPGAVLVSGNPVLAPSSGLDQGFRNTHVAERFGTLYGEDFLKALEDSLDEVQDGDLLVLNIADAHQPWTSIEEDHPWLPARRAIRWRPHKAGNLWRHWHHGERQKPKTRKAMLDLYDFAVWRADQTLDGALRRVSKRFEVAHLSLTSDHGENLGEGDLLGHGHYLTDPNQGVFVLSSDPVPKGLINATVVYDLVRGQPVQDHPVRAAAWPNRKKASYLENGLYTHTSVRTWAPDAQWTTPEPVPEGPLNAFVTTTLASTASESDPELEKSLEALGYF